MHQQPVIIIIKKTKLVRLELVQAKTRRPHYVPATAYLGFCPPPAIAPDGRHGVAPKQAFWGCFPTAAPLSEPPGRGEVTIKAIFSCFCLRSLFSTLLQPPLALLFFLLCLHCTYKDLASRWFESAILYRFLYVHVPRSPSLFCPEAADQGIKTSWARNTFHTPHTHTHKHTRTPPTYVTTS